MSRFLLLADKGKTNSVCMQEKRFSFVRTTTLKTFENPYKTVLSSSYPLTPAGDERHHLTLFV